MTVNDPPRLAMSLLSRCLPVDDPLTGDLIEDFAVGRSRAWFWRQTMVAISVRGSRAVRIGTVVVLTALIGPVAGYVAYARAVSDPAELPRLVQQLTIEEMIRSVRTDDVYAPLRFEGQVVDVTGVLGSVIPQVAANPRVTPALYVTSAFHLPEFGVIFQLDPSVDVADLTLGETVTLRCPVLDQHVSQSFCLVVPPS